MLKSPEYFRKSLDISDFVIESQAVVQDYKCPLCEGIYLSPVVDACGHIFCQECITKYMQTTSKECPISHRPLEDAKVNRLGIVNDILDKQHVLCKNREYNCSWQGKLCELDYHLNNSCKKQLIKCSNNNCPHTVFREDMALHVSACDYRIVQCEYCLCHIAFIQTGPHQEVCPNFRLSCHQGCFEMVERQLMSRHLTEYCIHTYVNCLYAEVGCSDRMKKKDVEVHLSNNMIKHNLLLLEYIKATEVKLNDKLIQVELLSNEKISYIQEQINTMIAAQKEKEREKERAREKAKEKEREKELELEREKEKEKENSKKKLNTITEPTAPISNMPESSSQNGLLISKKRQRVETEDPFITISKDPIIIKEDPSMDIELSVKESNSNKPSKKPVHPDTFDKSIISKGITINGSRAISSKDNKIEHKFAFTNLIMAEDTNTEWKNILNMRSGWAAVGVCIKEQVINNKLRFTNSAVKDFNHGCYVLSVNGFTWNASQPNENNKAISQFPAVDKCDTISIRYCPDKKELHYMIKSCRYIGKLTNVSVKKGQTLVACVIFLNPGDEIVVEPVNIN